MSSKLPSTIFTGERYAERCRYCGAKVSRSITPVWHDPDCPVRIRKAPGCLCGREKMRGDVLCAFCELEVAEVWDGRGPYPLCPHHGDPILSCRGCDGGSE